MDGSGRTSRGMFLSVGSRTSKLILVVRDKTLFFMHLAVACILGIFTGGLYFQVKTSISGFQNRIGSLFFMVSPDLVESSLHSLIYFLTSIYIFNSIHVLACSICLATTSIYFLDMPILYRSLRLDNTLRFLGLAPCILLSFRPIQLHRGPFPIYS